MNMLVVFVRLEWLDYWVEHQTAHNWWWWW